MSSPPSPTPPPAPPQPARDRALSAKYLWPFVGTLVTAAVGLFAVLAHDPDPIIVVGPTGSAAPPPPPITYSVTAEPAPTGRTTPRWSGKARLSGVGLDLDTLPAPASDARGVDVFLLGSGFTTPMLYVEGTSVAEWATSSVPSRVDCEQQMATQPITAVDVENIRVKPGIALCVTTAQGSVAFIKVTGLASDQSSATADMIVWPAV